MNRGLSFHLLLIALLVVSAAILTFFVLPYDQLRVAAQQPGSSAPVEVVISNRQFQPSSVTVSVGTTVTWVNNDTVGHTVTSTSPDNPFNSGTLQKGDRYLHLFDKPGTYAYACQIHPDMTGTIIVR